MKPETSTIKMKPTMRITEDDLPDIKSWQVGKTYKVEATVKQISSSIGDMMEDKSKKMEARFEIIDISSYGKEPKKKEVMEKIKEKAE